MRYADPAAQAEIDRLRAEIRRLDALVPNCNSACAHVGYPEEGCPLHGRGHDGWMQVAAEQQQIAYAQQDQLDQIRAILDPPPDPEPVYAHYGPPPADGEVPF